MREEVLEYLSCKPSGLYVDGTLGGGGHALEILNASAPDGRLIGLDCDEDAIAYARVQLATYSDRVTLVKSNFADIKDVMNELDVNYVDGILLDLGVSSHHFEQSERGFSISKDGPLDMRMDRENGKRAYDLVNSLSKEILTDIFKSYGEERWASRIAKAIVRKRMISPIGNTAEFAELVSSAIPKRFHPKTIHPATKVFQALRISINNELENLKAALKDGVELLKSGGVMIVISYHSLEDRIVKKHFRSLEGRCQCPPDMPICVCDKKAVIQPLTKKVVLPSEQEVAKNPRSRSAKLRAIKKLQVIHAQV